MIKGGTHTSTVDDTHIYAGGYTTQTVRKYLKSDLSYVGESADYGVSFSNDDIHLAVAHNASPFLTVYKTTLINPTNLISPALNTIPLKYDDLGYAKESGVENDEIEMVSIFR